MPLTTNNPVTGTAAAHSQTQTIFTPQSPSPTRRAQQLRAYLAALPTEQLIDSLVQKLVLSDPTLESPARQQPESTVAFHTRARRHHRLVAQWRDRLLRNLAQQQQRQSRFEEEKSARTEARTVVEQEVAGELLKRREREKAALEKKTGAKELANFDKAFDKYRKTVHEEGGRGVVAAVRERARTATKAAAKTAAKTVESKLREKEGEKLSAEKNQRTMASVGFALANTYRAARQADWTEADRFLAGV